MLQRPVQMVSKKCSKLHVQSYLYTTTTLGPLNLWPRLTGGRCSEVAPCHIFPKLGLMLAGGCYLEVVFKFNYKTIFLSDQIFGLNSFVPKQVQFVRPYGTAMAESDLDCALKCTINDDLYSGFVFNILPYRVCERSWPL
jgi:hypothetical protein